jgi:hypothetical protein
LERQSRLTDLPRADASRFLRVVRRIASSPIITAPALILGVIALVLGSRALYGAVGDKIVSAVLVFGVIGFCFGMATVHTFKPETWFRKVTCFAIGMLVIYAGTLLLGLIWVVLVQAYERMRATGNYTVIRIVLASWAVAAVFYAVFWLADRLRKGVKRWVTDIMADAIRKSRDR